MLRSKEGLLVLAVAMASLITAGCATTPDTGVTATKEVASTDETKADKVFCQTDDDTGSRLSRHTSCTDADSSAAQQAARSMQNGGYIGPPGH